jgi:hypothetical protein
MTSDTNGSVAQRSSWNLAIPVCGHGKYLSFPLNDIILARGEAWCQTLGEGGPVLSKRIEGSYPKFKFLTGTDSERVDFTILNNLVVTFKSYGSCVEWWTQRIRPLNKADIAPQYASCQEHKGRQFTLKPLIN